MFKKNDILVVVDKKNPYYLKLGKIVILEEGIIAVEFRNISELEKMKLFDLVYFDEESLSRSCRILAFR